MNDTLGEGTVVTYDFDFYKTDQEGETKTPIKVELNTPK